MLLLGRGCFCFGILYGQRGVVLAISPEYYIGPLSTLVLSHFCGLTAWVTPNVNKITPVRVV